MKPSRNTWREIDCFELPPSPASKKDTHGEGGAKNKKGRQVAKERYSEQESTKIPDPIQSPKR